MTGIEILFDFHPGRPIFLVAKQVFPIGYLVCRHGIGQTPGQHLRQTGVIEVRQITSRVPSLVYRT